MSADRLREAARVLRERAEGADDGPWTYDGQTVWNYWPGTAATATGLWENGTYIATVDPAFGLAVADVLDEVAGLAQGLEGDWLWKQPPGLVRIRDKALAVADAVLGDAS